MQLNLNHIVLYVKDLKASTTFYTNILEREPLEPSPTFVLFRLDSGLGLGLKDLESVEPKMDVVGISHELILQAKNNEMLDAFYHSWAKQNITLVQKPTMMVYGYNFVALDPDQNRLRVFVPQAS